MLRQMGNAAGQSAPVAQIWRLPGAPHAEGIWHVCPPPSQQTNPVAHSEDAAQSKVAPLGQDVPALHVLEPPASAPALQQSWPVAQSPGAQICGLPAGHEVPDWHAFAAPPAPAQHT
jgi:hypothetical protein